LLRRHSKFVFMKQCFFLFGTVFYIEFVKGMM